VRIRDLAISGAFEITPRQHSDDRGTFLESYRFEVLAEALGHRFELAQANTSVSARGVLRGVHYADVPPGQAKYVMCASGAALDVVVDLRVGSSTFGRWDAARLDDVDRRAVYLSEGLGHAFLSLQDGTTMTYLCSTVYSPGREHGVHPLDPDLGIEWPADVERLLSAKDAAAPTVSAALEGGLLPRLDECTDWARGARSAASGGT